jgi:hypothetical protein
MLIRSGVLRLEEARTLFDRTLRADPPWSMTYWHRYADLDAAWRVGAIGWGLEYIRRHWGHAVKLNWTALWETFDPAWVGSDQAFRGPDLHAVSMVAAEHARYGGYETSLCHGWSAGPAVWLHRAVLGVTPAAPGFAEIDFRPTLCDLTSASGRIPTPRGPIEVYLADPQDGTRRRATITLPAGIKVRGLEDVERDWDVQVERAR